ncbi:cell wall-associated NlpC family hydrolase [Paenibacillus taihuensis]|uniref:Cell wall-associated NlpC family hydrolase n=1 Tax=Paenibacillus taihuensis TaxID=1156355 RepID=A0A3D9SLI6_9BACL|nr:C40 family peptidase [Paenibacillus taihuensis]REE92765.1 cell wall-associated NlpC family hydrolase [Paenibacillus taihuensis]
MKKITAALLVFILAALLVIPAAMAAVGTSPVVGEIQSSVSFRSQPSTSSTVYKYLKSGDNVVILEEVNAYWYKVQDMYGSIGYVSSSEKYIDIIYNATIAASVNFRTAPSTDGSKIRLLSKGESVLITGQPNRAWFAVTDSNGKKGYVSSQEQYITTGPAFSMPEGAAAPSTPSTPATPSESVTIENIIATGMKYWGTPYEFGSDRNTTATFDCSDFVRQAFREGAGITLPADSRKQGDYVKANGPVKTDWHQLKRGDLMFFMEYKGSKASSYDGVNKSTETITHVGIYLGNGQILHTYSTESGGVRTSDIANTQWDYRFLFGGSAL